MINDSLQLIKPKIVLQLLAFKYPRPVTKHQSSNPQFRNEFVKVSNETFSQIFETFQLCCRKSTACYKHHYRKI